MRIVNHRLASEFGARMSIVFGLCKTQLDACYVLKLASPSQMSRYVRCLGAPSFDVLMNIGIVGINLNWLVFGEGPQWTDTPTSQRVQAHLSSGQKITVDFFYREILPLTHTPSSTKD